MANPIFDLIRGILGGAGKIVDDLTTTDEEKLQAKAALLALEVEASKSALEYEKTLAVEQGQTIRSEASGHSWMQRNWRPITMLTFVYIVAHNYVVSPVFGAPSLPIPPDMWDLIKIGLGGYVIGRSAEKIIPASVQALKGREET